MGIHDIKSKLMTMIISLLALLLILGGCSASNGNNGAAADKGAPARGTDSSTTESAADDRGRVENKASEPEAHQEEVRRQGRTDAPIEAGQLTAGEWDDLAAWERFNNVMNSYEGSNSSTHWGFEYFNRLEVLVTSDGRAVSDATVKLIGQQKEIVWEARTNAEGKAYLFAGLFRDHNDEQFNQRTRYSVEVLAEQQKKKVSNIEVPGQGALKVDLDGELPVSDQVDVMFVLDTTGSMQDEMDYLEAELNDVITRAKEQHANQLDIRMSTNFYRDIHDDYVVKANPFTTNIDQAVRLIAMQKAQGGGDYPEAVEQALRNAVSEHKWSENARARLLFLVLDAPPHHETQIMQEMHSVIADAAKEGIRIIPVASSGVDADTEYLLRFAAVATGGTYLFLTDDSGIGSDHLEPAVGEFETKLLNDLLVEVINRYVH
ncbi:VWA domain-containing protein [Paenibacillus glycanilyticus]|uniref:VWA domain-containing protein n=1 Tax=Paenibacillus glycanilyticus TaxID=126569 RepID=UPI00203E9502|nr:VWA domain-containing protein [Paenibacillus glycanilyticus]MCM3628945.1 VWA domain-containing protein [Paenibacillus glycanilyticus]